MLSRNVFGAPDSTQVDSGAFIFKFYLKITINNNKIITINNCSIMTYKVFSLLRISNAPFYF